MAWHGMAWHGALSCFLKEEYEVLEKMVRLERGVEADGNLREHESQHAENYDLVD